MFHIGVQAIKVDIGQYWAYYASYNRAKLPLEFFTLIERSALKVRYGEGFGGAPLHAIPAMHRVITGVRESGDEQAHEQGSSPVGGNDHV